MTEYVAADPARAAACAWYAEGWSMRSIASAAGVNPGVVADLIDGSRPSMREFTADAILGVTRALLERYAATVPATATRRRLQHLQLQGYSQVVIALAVGVSQHNLSCISRGVHQTVSVDLRDRIHAYFAAHWLNDGGGTRTRRHALAQGWVPAAAWDDIDDPHETPKGAAA